MNYIEFDEEIAERYFRKTHPKMSEEGIRRMVDGARLMGVCPEWWLDAIHGIEHYHKAVYDEDGRLKDLLIGRRFPDGVELSAVRHGASATRTFRKEGLI